MPFTGTRRALLLVALAALATTSCGYSLAGRGAFLPESVKTIGIPLFVNRTPFFQIEQVLTQKVRSEFIGRGKYKVLPQATDVDAVVQGEITSMSILPTSFDQQQQASQYVITLVARMELRDLKANRVIWQNPSLVFRDEYQLTSGNSSISDPTAFLGQEGNAVERLGNDFARTVVSAILEAF
jgi:hypothetical protein